ncbi:calcium-activated chloride channel-domain-containing protein [Ochromonadaceae sp. CCMP2298]|nr:calcium-activated chloride channel-domain-containing protein [Ochromonadaceae sp. CCMP2298]
MESSQVLPYKPSISPHKPTLRITINPIQPTSNDQLLTYNLHPPTYTAVADDVVDELVELAGADYVYMYYSSKKSLFKTEIRVNVLIRVKMKLIKHKAEADEYRLMLDAYAAQQMAYEGDPDAFVDSFQIPHLPEISTIAPFEYIYAPYVSTPEQQDLYDRPRGMQHPFHKLVRVKLFQRLLTSGRDSLSPDFLQQGGVVLDYFPVHDRDLLKSLGNSWLTLCSLPWSQPFNSVKDYFGEQVGIFFYFLGVLSLWATPLTLVGLGLQVLALYYWDFHRAELPAFALLLALFLPILLTRWSRAQQILAMKWDMTGSTDRTALSDPIRYAFYGVRTKSYIDGSDTIYFPRIRRRGLYLVSALFCILAGLLCLITTGAVFYARNELREVFDRHSTPIIVGLIRTVTLL